VKHDQLPDSCCIEIVPAKGEAAQMQATDRALGEAPELTTAMASRNNPSSSWRVCGSRSAWL
jgi:hypothetical protein